jgi:hypothetical protein
MDREMILQHLAQAEEHVATGAKHLTRQRELIAKLERDGHDTSEAQVVLSQFEELQAIHIAGRDRLQEELEQSGPREAVIERPFKAQRCLNNAARCDRLASQVRDPLVGVTLSEVAAQWRRIASQIKWLESEKASSPSTG